MSQYTLAYLTSAWVKPIDEILLPWLYSILDEMNEIKKEKLMITFLQVHWSPQDTDTSSTNDTKTKVQRLQPILFRLRCKELQVTDLPACVLLDAKGQVLTQKLLQSFDDEVCQLYKSNATLTSFTDFTLSWKVFRELLENNGVIGATWDKLRPLWLSNMTLVQSAAFQPLKVDDGALVKMRQEALALYEAGEFLSAATSFVNILLIRPTCTKSSFNLAVILQSIGETYFAVSNMLRVVALDDSDSVAHTVLRSVYYPKEPDLVVAGYRLILSANRDGHVRATHSLATLEDAITIRTAAPAYVAEVFDELADSFEEKLVAHLEYHVPWQLVEALQILSPAGFISTDSKTEPTWVVADVGCGTGLCGRLLRPHVKHIVGVDISPLMIEKTREKGSYDELHTVDIVPFLESCANESLDLVISADVWIYVGALEQVFELSARKLRASTGWMAFSIELCNPRATDNAVEYRLASSGRFQHAHSYIASLASCFGFTIALQEGITVRKESGEPIPGRIYLLHRDGSSAE
ncbi:unnamed protein product [Peronospora belbahrii]|uniref:Methyltransferase type 11 domain-containing protein n=1 Tax=Peronospora belbahrii TaxID=622444 RepID=A0AAU9LGL9_9STRA|nr:unnamed protein product [Peronospora belbahrii]CAH0522438.1 unnamed protein product [Peronospora belbahrii]